MIVIFGRHESATAATPSAKDAPPKSVAITLYPAAEPQPALKYQLLPPLLDRRPGNAAMCWNRIFDAHKAFFKQFVNEIGCSGKIGAWMKIPLDDPREKEYREKKLTKIVDWLRSSDAYSDMDRAARFESCDWQLPIHEGNYITILLPEMENGRDYSRLLSAKARLEIAEGKYGEAVRTLQTGYAESRHVAQGPTLINAFVGVTIASIMDDRVEEWIQRPDSPNLYWALSMLPKPLVDFRPGLEAESNLLYLQFPELRGIDKKQMSPEEWNRWYDRLWSLIQLEHYKKSIPKSPEHYYAAAKRYLIAQGHTVAEVDAMSKAQAVVLHWVHRYQSLSNDCFKWFLSPATDIGDRLEELRKQGQSLAHENPLAATLLSGIVAAKEAEVRDQWTLARLRVFEALRLYAATHDGRWPDCLSDITTVPVPKNPYDDKPFGYQRDGDRATLTSEHGPPGLPWQYDITLKKKLATTPR